MKGIKILIIIAGMILAVPLYAVDDFSEDEIENEEALANSDAALAEKKELKNLRESEKQRATAEKAAAEKAKQRAKQVQQQATKENDKLMKDVKVWRTQRKAFEDARVVSEKAEAKQRGEIERIKIERDKWQVQLDQAKKARDDAKAAYKASIDLYKTLKADLDKMQRDRQKLAEATKNLKIKTAEVNKKNDILEKRIQGSYKVPTAAAVRPVATKAAERKPSKMPEERRLKVDCNLRLGPSSKAEVYKILRRGEPVMVHNLDGIWWAVGTREIEKAYLSKPCL